MGIVKRNPAKRVYYKVFGDGKKCIIATSFDGESKVYVYFSKKPTTYEQGKVKDFLLGELDDHDAYTKFCNKYR